jgi:hypothetical protein
LLEIFFEEKNSLVTKKFYLSQSKLDNTTKSDQIQNNIYIPHKQMTQLHICTERLGTSDCQKVVEQSFV